MRTDSICKMSFLSIPREESHFIAIKTRQTAEEAADRPPIDNEDDDDDEEDDDTENIRLIPRCSPVPRKRGSSIYDETAEYMRIHLALSAGKRVSFADTTGGDLIDVKEFIAYDTDEEEDSARWEEEEAKYRKPQREPTYRVRPEFEAPTGDALLQAVRTNKVEVEQIASVENEPFAFSGVIRVLNISFHKAVYVRSTMDNWVTYFDHPAEYVQGSHDGDTDQFSFKLSFAPPYITHDSRIEFVVRFETCDGDFWANNSSLNYAVTLLLSYEDDSDRKTANIQQTRGILKPPKAYSMNDEFDSEDEQEKGAATETSLVRPVAVCPAIVQPEIDIETGVHPSGPSVQPNRELPSADSTLSTYTVFPGEQFPCLSPQTTLQTDSSVVLRASESIQPDKLQPRLHCELSNQTLEQPTDGSPSVLLPASVLSTQQESRPRSESRDKSLPPKVSRILIPTTEMKTWPVMGEDSPTDSPTSCTHAELSTESVSVTHGFEVAVGSNETVAKFSEESTGSALAQEGSTPTFVTHVAESQACFGAEQEAPPSPEFIPNQTPAVSEMSQNVHLQPVSALEVKEDAAQNLLETSSEVSELRSEHDISRNLIPAAVGLGGIVSFSIALQQPSTLFFIGLLLVLHRL